MIVRRPDPSDLPEIAELYRRALQFPSTEKFDEYWAWKVLGNPGHRGPEPPFWVAREGGALVGGMAEIPVRLVVGGRVVTAAWAVDFMIDPRCRGRGLGKALFDHYRRNNDVAISMGNPPGSPTSSVTRAIGFTACPPLTYVFKLLTTKPVTGRLPLGGVFGPAIDRLSRRPLRWINRLPRRPASSVTIGDITSFGPDFDALWTTVERDTAVSVRRDHATMNWRYRDNPFQRYRVLGARRGDALAACAVFKIVRHHEFTYATLAELIVPPRAVDVQDALLARVIEELEREDVDIVKALASAAPLAGGLRRAGFRPFGAGCDFVIATTPALEPDFAAHLDPRGWSLTKGDSDLDMVPDFMSRLAS